MRSKIVESQCLVIDVDGTICALRDDGTPYSRVEPIEDVVETLREYRARGFHIILHTSRNMRTHGGSIGRINADTLKTLLAWLDEHGVPYDEIHVGKPWPGEDGFYVDDRAVRPTEFLSRSYEEIQELLKMERAAIGKSRLSQP